MMASKTLVCSLLCLSALAGVSPVRAGGLNQSPAKPPPTLKVPRSSDLPPPKVRKRFDRAKNTTYVEIDVQLPQPERSGTDTSAAQITVGETSLNFRLEFKGSSASELSAAYLTVNFVGDGGRGEESVSAAEVDVRADAYQYTYQRAKGKTEQAAPAENAARPTPLKQASVTVELPPGDLEQVAYANRVDIRIGKQELRVRSIQLADLRKVLITRNAN